MISLKLLISIILFLSSTVFILFFGRLPAFRNNPIGKLNRLLSVHLPNAFLAVDQRVTGGRTCLSLARGGRFLMNDRHPTVLILFILLMLIPEIMFLPPVLPATTTTVQFLIVIIVCTPYAFLYLSASTDPGSITPENHSDVLSLYPADHILYCIPLKQCTTCNLPKPPRSKHCSICKVCVARADHHCVFINRCVGYNNTHHFILLLLSSSILVGAGVFLGVQFLQTHIPLSHPGFNLWGAGLSWSNYWPFLSFLLVRWTRVSSITLLCTLMFPLVCALTGYQIYLIWAGTTTNETSKWSDMVADIKDGIAFKRALRVEESFGNKSYWPKQAREIVARTNDGKPPRGKNALALPGQGEWVRVESLHELDNIYDLGFWHNAADVFMRKDN